MAAQNDIIYGLHAVEAVLKHQPQQVQTLWVSRRKDQRFAQVLALAESLGVNIQSSTMAGLSEKCPQAAVHQGVVAIVKPKVWNENQIPNLLMAQSAPVVLVLDQITDPHNLGACLRSANGFGVTCVIAPQDGSATLTPVARKVACGAAAVTPFIRVKNLARTLRQLKETGMWIVGTAGEESCSLQKIDFTGSVAIVMGAEGRGMRTLTRKHCDYLVKIDLAGSVSSLNVSVATGICLYEMSRQRQLS